MGSDLNQLVRQAKNGDRRALETIVDRIQDRIYGMALRMLGQPADAEDETQEILIKTITHLSSFREECAFTSWVYRIACNHLLSTRKRNTERMSVTFELLEELITDEPTNDCLSSCSEPERAFLIEEAKLDCLQGILICLDKEVRIAFILGIVFGVTSEEGAYILDITPEAFRKRVSRARASLREFMLKHCGLVNENNACRCEKRVAGRNLKPGASQLKYASSWEGGAEKRKEAMMQLKEMDDIERVALIFRSYQEYRSPDSFTHIVKTLIDSGEYRLFTR